MFDTYCLPAILFLGDVKCSDLFLCRLNGKQVIVDFALLLILLHMLLNLGPVINRPLLIRSIS